MKVFFFDSDLFNFWLETASQKDNLFLFGELLYEELWFLVAIVAVILLIAMVGSIVLTVDSISKKSKEKTNKELFD